MIDRTNLVVLKADKELFICNELFKPNRNYRCISIEENKRIEHLVYGVVFDEKTFNETFEYSYDRIMKHFKLVGLIGKDNIPLTKTAFEKQADIHTYTGGG